MAHWWWPGGGAVVGRKKKSVRGAERRAAGSGGGGQGGGQGLQAAAGRAAGSAGRRQLGSEKARELGAWRCSGARLGSGSGARRSGWVAHGGPGSAWPAGAGDRELYGRRGPEKWRQRPEKDGGATDRGRRGRTDSSDRPVSPVPCVDVDATLMGKTRKKGNTLATIHKVS
ncbi:uncharacterized protein LOC131861077 [Cryptomeria japonica]|uniref:uncharacterized protein LOC131861077 n=1 Tax=Cryptomeria japonica TaxID=3369 RepID=UPI0027DA5CE9|nr:uncharacterized protein LOC131861077 [Cryptomeria japonica]